MQTDLYPLIKSFFLKRVSSPELAEDLTQEVFLKITKASTNNDDIIYIKAWVFKVANNTLVDYYRKNRVMVEFTEELGLSEVEPPPHREEVFSCVTKMMSNLNEKDKSLLKKVDLEGLSQIELSAELNISYTTLKSRVQRARKKLHEKLITCCNFDKDNQGMVRFCSKKI